MAALKYNVQNYDSHIHDHLINHCPPEEEPDNDK